MYSEISESVVDTSQAMTEQTDLIGEPRCKKRAEVDLDLAAPMIEIN